MLGIPPPPSPPAKRACEIAAEDEGLAGRVGRAHQAQEKGRGDAIADLKGEALTESRAMSYVLDFVRVGQY